MISEGEGMVKGGAPSGRSGEWGVASLRSAWGDGSRESKESKPTPATVSFEFGESSSGGKARVSRRGVENTTTPYFPSPHSLY